MNPSRLLFDEDAVSPVIGVILMVAITSILAAVAGVFVLGFETGEQPTPSTSFVAEPSDQTINTNTVGTDETVQVVTIRHRSGDALDPARLSVTVDREPAFGVETSTPNDTARRLYDSSADITAGDEQVVVAVYNSSAGGTAAAAVGAEYTSSGGELTVEGSSSVDELQTGETVRIRWKNERDERSAVIFEHDVGS